MASVKVTVSIERALRDKMVDTAKKHRVNWSQVASKAFTTIIEELEKGSYVPPAKLKPLSIRESLQSIEDKLTRLLEQSKGDS